MRHCATYGNTLSEYGLILGLVALAAIGGASLFGQSTFGLFTQTDAPLQSNAAQKLVSMDFGSSSSATSPALESNARSAASVPLSQADHGLLQLANTSSGGTNATSSEGNKAISSLHTMSFAQQMEQIAAQESDASLQKIFADLAYYTYYLSGTEASLAGMSAFTPKDASGILRLAGEYNDGNMLHDIMTFRNKISALSAKLPTNAAASSSVQQMLALAKDAIANTKPYDAAIKKVTGADGKATISEFQAAFGPSLLFLPSLSSLTGSKDSYTDKVDYEALKATVQQSLANKSAAPHQNVENTMKDATQMDQKAAG